MLFRLAVAAAVLLAPSTAAHDHDHVHGEETPEGLFPRAHRAAASIGASRRSCAAALQTARAALFKVRDAHSPRPPPLAPAELSYVTCGSVIKLQHEDTGFFLHSHEVNYGSGSKQQVRRERANGAQWTADGARSEKLD